MAFDRPTAKRIFGWSAVFLLGFIAGGLVVESLSAYAIGAYLRAVQLTFAITEEEQASKAWRAGRYDEALGHSFCRMEAEHGLGATRAFAPESIPWSGIGIALTRKMLGSGYEKLGKGLGTGEAVDRAIIGVAWERLGQKEPADKAFAAAARLTGESDVARLRRLGLATVDMWSKVREQPSGPAPSPDAAQVPSSAR